MMKAGAVCSGPAKISVTLKGEKTGSLDYTETRQKMKKKLTIKNTKLSESQKETTTPPLPTN